MSYRLRNFVIAAVLALLAGILTTAYVKGYKHRVQRGENLVPVLVATRDIPAGTSAARAHLAVRKIERRNVIAGAVSADAKLAGLFALAPTYAGEQITANRFARASQLGPRGAIHGRLRLMAVPGNRDQLLQGVAKAGDHVDVVAALPTGESNVVKPAHVILRDVPVLRAAEQVAAGSKLGSSSSDQQPSVLLGLTDTQAKKLFFAMANGEWTIVLRPIDRSAR
jgi:pilus assembly protein CpaB